MPSTSHASATPFPTLLNLANEQLRATGEVVVPVARSGWSTFKRAVMSGVAFVADKLGPIGALLMSIIPKIKQVAGLVYDVACHKFQRFVEHRFTCSTRSAPAGFVQPDPDAAPKKASPLVRPDAPIWPDEVMAEEARREASALSSPGTTADAAPTTSASAVALDEIDLAAVLEAASLVDDEEMTRSTPDAAGMKTSSERLPSIELDAFPTAPLVLATLQAPAHASRTGVATEDADTRGAPHGATPSAMPAARRTPGPMTEAPSKTRDVAPTEADSLVARSRGTEPDVANDVEGSRVAKRSRSLMRPLLSLVRVMGAERSARGSKLTH